MGEKDPMYDASEYLVLNKAAEEEYRKIQEELEDAKKEYKELLLVPHRTEEQQKRFQKIVEDIGVSGK